MFARQLDIVLTDRASAAAPADAAAANGVIGRTGQRSRFDASSDRRLQQTWRTNCWNRNFKEDNHV